MLDLIERKPVRDEFVSGLSHAELLGDGNARFWLYVIETENGRPVFVVRQKIVMSLAMLPDAIGKAIPLVSGAMLSKITSLVAPRLMH